MNYVSYFGLREPPFGITPDTSFFYAGRGTQEALNTLLVALANGEGFIKITGEVGTGKTLLCRKFLGTLDAGWVSAYIPNPTLDPRGLLLAIAEELGVAIDVGVDQHRLLKSINKCLLDLARLRKRVVLCMDECQAMPLETLEAVRLLTNLETEKRKLLHVVLFGQPELDRRLAEPTIRQLLQRITFHYSLDGLHRDEVGAYAAHRLAIAGYAREPMFSQDALTALHRGSRGVPRLVNILAHKSLLLVFGEGGDRVERRHVVAAIGDTPAASAGRSWWPWLRITRASD
ncbi:MAG TPA: AAA family ATPase [Burkholderiales bacterium]|nr:AAA family ATPase [Burkholderiales bacterium]